MIQVLENFGGKLTNEQRILPGVYADDDPRLFGCVEYLLEHHKALRLDEPKAETNEPVLLHTSTSAASGKSASQRPNKRRGNP